MFGLHSTHPYIAITRTTKKKRTAYESLNIFRMNHIDCKKRNQCSLDGVKGNVAKTPHHHERQFGQTHADDKQQRTAQEDECCPGQEQPLRCGAKCLDHVQAFNYGCVLGRGRERFAVSRVDTKRKRRRSSN